MSNPKIVGTTAELVDAMQSFVDAFTRWSKTRAAAAGPSLSRLRVLNTLHCEGPQKMVDLADTLGVTPRSVTALVDGLEGEGLVRRVAHPTDRRITMIELTAEAPDAAELFAAHQASIADLCSLMTSEEQQQYLELTRRLEERLRSVQTLSS
jgi:DNA-binding MarR family transcriptional regulator